MKFFFRDSKLYKILFLLKLNKKSNLEWKIRRHILDISINPVTLQNNLWSNTNKYQSVF